jgi:DNA-binding response OmpR family regulator
MSVEVLLLSRDLALLNVMRRVCDEAGIALQLATDAPEAEDMLARAKFDGLVADCDDVPSATTVIQNLRKGASNRSAVVFAIRNCAGITVRDAFEIGANFVLDKPVNVDRAATSGCQSKFRSS